MNPVIEVHHLTKKFRQTVALDDVSLRVPAGVVFAVLGENGAGKTTLIQALMGLIKPNAGSLRVLGLDPRKQAVELRRKVGYVPDSPALYQWMTVKEIGWFAGGFYGPQFYGQFEKLVESYQLEMDQPIKHLSKGGKAKVTLALSMAHRPELLILDEPTSGLDTLVRRHFLESMIDVAAEGRTVLLSSHQISEVERVADWVAVIHHGRIAVCDTLENLKANFERWVVTLESSSVDFSVMGATVVHHEGNNQKRQQFVVRDCHPETLWRIREQSGVLDVEIHPPTLEEVFVAIMKAAPQSPAAGLPQASSSNDNAGEARS